MNIEFIHHFRTVKEQPFLMVEESERNKGMSLTNCIHRVVEQICVKQKRNPVEYHIIYKDSEGFWDAYMFSLKSFTPIRERHWLKAASKYLQNL